MKSNEKVRIENSNNNPLEVIINGKRLKRAHGNAFSIPIETLEMLTVEDLKSLEEIVITLDTESDAFRGKYPGLYKFPELRLSVFNDKDDDGIAISAVVFTPKDIDILGLHGQYQLKLTEVLSRYEYVSIWQHPKADKEKMIETANHLTDVEKLTGVHVDYDPVGYVGFHIFVKADDYRVVLERLSEFLTEADRIARDEIVSSFPYS